MKMPSPTRLKGNWVRTILGWVNLRPEEGERTLLMFAFHTTTSIGLLWLEYSAIALFLEQYGAKWLPVIYIASSVICSGLGVLYSWLQSILPLRSVLVAIAILAALPLLVFRLGLEIEYGYITVVTIFLLRLWMDAVYILNDLNSQVTANQLFNIREIKRTYPLISSGLLAADVLSGFSLPLLLLLVGLNNVVAFGSGMMLVGALTLVYICQHYQQAFPNSPARQWEEMEPDFAVRQPSESLRRYVIPLFAFFILGEALYLLIEFQYMGQLEQTLDSSAIAGFLGLFSGTLGLFELVTQWFISSRVIDRFGLFLSAMVLPGALSVIGLVTLAKMASWLKFDIGLPSWITGLFIGVVLLRFVDELLRFTLIASVEPVLFQALPSGLRSVVQTTVQGIAKPMTTGITGLGILATIGLLNWAFPNFEPLRHWVFILMVVIFALLWLLSTWLMRANYGSLLLINAEQGRLGSANTNFLDTKTVFEEAVRRLKTEPNNRSAYIQLLSQIAPEKASKVLSPLLGEMSTDLQRQSLEVMLPYPNPDCLKDVSGLIDQRPPVEVLALALRYFWLAHEDLNIRTIKPYLQPAVDPTVRATAAALIMGRGTPKEKFDAVKTLRRMLTSKKEQERLMGTRALADMDYLESLVVYIDDLLRDKSLKVRCACLEVIAAKRFEKYYPSLVKALYYTSTRNAARMALVKQGDEAIPLLRVLSEDIHKPDLVRRQAWMALGEIGRLHALTEKGTPEAMKHLVQQLMSSWGTTRRNILTILLKIPGEVGIEAVMNQLGRSGIETLIEQELMFLGQIYGALLDLTSKKIAGLEADLLRQGLNDLQQDLVEVCFLLMKFLYPSSAIKAAEFNLASHSRSNIALGLEILDNTLDIPNKKAFLSILDRRSLKEKLGALVDLVPYKPMGVSDRLRRLIELRHFLSDWPLACCFHVARAAHCSLAPAAAMSCLRHPTGFVREAVVAYLKEMSPRACAELLPVLRNDPDPLVAAQAQQIIG
ncbi:MFS transporter [Moorena producens PAL-8-15-08-1]|uniref:MFS transporter n=2 Tax=Moorena TaxID=1155738 RepID=A0A1D8TUH3_9CYAN|nr:MFS transporter [Moorena producens PAL-8-15-08-1]